MQLLIKKTIWLGDMLSGLIVRMLDYRLRGVRDLAGSMLVSALDCRLRGLGSRPG